MIILETLGKTFHQLTEILEKKGADYSSYEDEFSNFKLSSSLSGVSVETSIIVRMTDKLARLGNLTSKDPNVTEETLEDTINDLIGYAVILKAYRTRNLE